MAHPRFQIMDQSHHHNTALRTEYSSTVLISFLYLPLIASYLHAHHMTQILS